MPTALFKPNFAQMSPRRQKLIKQVLSEIVKRPLSMEKTEQIYHFCSSHYRSICDSKRGYLASKKKEA